MTRGKGKNVEILSPSERQVLEDEKRELQDSLKEADQYGKGTAAEQMDRSTIKKQIDRIDHEIDSRQAPKVRGAAKDDLVKEAEELALRLQENMPTKDEMRYPVKNPGAVRKHMNWCKKNAVNVERYRYIQRIINPEDPRSVENLRKEK